MLLYLPDLTEVLKVPLRGWSPFGTTHGNYSGTLGAVKAQYWGSLSLQ